MNSKIIALSKYRLEEAKEDLTASRINLENGLIKASINIFHSIRAVNALNDFDSKKHSGVMPILINSLFTRVILKRIFIL